MNDLSRMIDRMKRADKETDPLKSMRVLMGWTCSKCLKDFDPGQDGPLLGIRLTVGLPILCPDCSAPGQPV